MQSGSERLTLEQQLKDLVTSENSKVEKEDVYCDVSEENTYDMESLDCPVCLESYDEGRHTPKMMPCLHTLCTSCITNLTCDTTKTDEPTPNPQGAANTATTARNTRISTLINALESRAGHAVLQRTSGRGPNSPTTRQPDDPLPPTPATSPTSPPTTPTSHVSIRRPDVSPPLPPTSEPQISKGLMVQCPLCRTEVSTSKLQTNRYVLAHMRDLKRLSRTPHIPEAFFVSRDFWCEDCKKPATQTCGCHELTPIAKWVETQKATIESLQIAVEDQLDQHTIHLQGLENMMRDIFHSLNKASRFIWDAKKRVQEMKEHVGEYRAPATASPIEEAEMLVKKVAWLEGEAAKASRRELTEGDSDVLVSLSEQDKKRLLVITYNPDLAVSVTVTHGHTMV